MWRERGFISGATLGVVFLLLWGCFLVFFITRGVFVQPEIATSALDARGYSKIEIYDKAWFFVGLRGCDMHDAARFTANAKNPNGKYVILFVCTGWPFKGATIRTR